MTTLPPIKVSYSQLNTFRDCPLKFRWHYIDGWRQQDDISVNLLLGSVWHRMLEAHYGIIQRGQQGMARNVSPRRGTPEETRWLAVAREAAMSEFRNAPEAEFVAADKWEALPWMLEGYQEQYGCDPNWRILDVEYMGLVPLGTIHTPKGEREVILDFRIDQVVEDLELGGIFAIEQKSTATLSTRFALELDDQTGLYEWAFRKSDHPLASQINGCVRSEAKKGMNAGDKPGATRGKAQELSSRFQRMRIPRTPVELDSIARDALATTQAAYGGDLPIYSAPNPAQCGWKCGFDQVHVLARKGRPVPVLMKDFGFAQVPTEFNGVDPKE